MVTSSLCLFLTSGVSDCKEMDLQISQLAKSHTQPDYVRLLTFVADSTVEVKRQSTSLLLYLVHVAALLLRDHPSRSYPLFLILSETQLLLNRFVDSHSKVYHSMFGNIRWQFYICRRST